MDCVLMQSDYVLYRVVMGILFILGQGEKKSCLTLTAVQFTARSD